MFHRNLVNFKDVLINDHDLFMNYNLFCTWLQSPDLMLFISDWSYSILLRYQKGFAWYKPSKNFDVHIFQFIYPIQFCGRCRQGCARNLSSYILGILALPARSAQKIRSLSKECVCFIRFVDLQEGGGKKKKKVSTIWWRWAWMGPAGKISMPLQLRSRTNPVPLWVGESLLLR